MNEIETTEIKQIELEINFYKGQAVQSIFEIGERLIRAKELVPKGEWYNWLEKEVKFSRPQAERFMRVSSEFSNRSTLNGLNQSKIFALLSVPKEEREAFIEENTVEDMTTRELRQAIKEKKELEEKLEESRVKQIELLNKNEELKNKESKEIVKEVIPEHVKIQLSQLKETQNKLKKLQEQNKELNNYDQAKSDIEREINNLIKKKHEQQQAYDEMTILADNAKQMQSIETARKRFIRRIKVSTDDLRKQRYSIEELFKEVGDVGEEAKRLLIKEAEFLEGMSGIFRQMASDTNTINANYEIIEGEIINE